MQGPTINSLDDQVNHINELADKLRAYMNHQSAGMPTVTCPVCNARYYGWALVHQDNDCDRCGQVLERG